MSKRTTVHDTFVINRTFAFRPELVFAAWASAAAKAQWFVGPSGWQAKLRELDFRVGGREQVIGEKADGFVSRFDARYHEIVPNQRIVYVYDMYVNDRQLSTSLATIEFEEQGTGTALIITEQGVFPNGLEDARSREHGTHGLIDQLERALQRQSGG